MYKDRRWILLALWTSVKLCYCAGAMGGLVLRFVCVISTLLLAVSCRQETAKNRHRVAWPTPLPLPTAQITVGDATLHVEIARTPQEHARGLMFRQSLPEDCGMLFVFDDDNFRRFWMRNTFIPLSIAFVRSDGTICNILDMEPHDEKGNYWSTERVRFAIEANRGWFARHGVRATDRVILPDDIPRPAMTTPSSARGTPS